LNKDQATYTGCGNYIHKPRPKHRSSSIPHVHVVYLSGLSQTIICRTVGILPLLDISNS